MIEQQLIFIERYLNEKGDVDKVLKSMNLEMNHFLLWRRNREFDVSYKEAQRMLISHLNCENYTTGLRRLNEILIRGYGEEQITSKQKITQRPRAQTDILPADDEEDEDENYMVSITEYEVERKVLKKPIPAQMLALALQQNSLVQAINTLNTQGILPDKISRQLMAKSEEIANEMRMIVQGNQESSNQMDEKKAIDLMKTAILKGIE